MYRLILVIFFVGLSFISCDEDNAPFNGNGKENASLIDDYTATTEVKTVVLKYEPILTDNNGFKTERNKIIYEDFNCSYDLLYSLKYGIVIAPYERVEGYWDCFLSSNSRGMYILDYYKCFSHLISIGKVHDISKITTKDILPTLDGYYYCSVEVQPNYGYAGYFLTEDGEKKFIRLWLENYELDEDGRLVAVTVQYQLY